MKDINKELNELSSILDRTDNNRIFKQSDEYFAGMQESVMAKIANGDRSDQSGRVFNLFRISSVAAAVVLILSVFVLIDSKSSKSQELPMELVYEYLYDNINKIDEDMIIALAEEDIFEPGAFLFDDLEEAEKYLEDNPELLDLLDLEYFY